MSSTVTILGLTSGPIFGCPDTTYGAGNTLDHTKVNAEEHTLQDGNGEVIAAAFTKGERTISFTCGVKGTLTATEGSSITIDGQAAFVKSVKLQKKRGDFAEYSIECVYWDGITATASSATASTSTSSSAT